MWRKNTNPTDKLINQAVNRLIQINPPKTILDMGGRDGWIAYELVKYFPDAEVTVADIDPSEFGKYPFKYVQSDMFENIEGTFDLIISDTNYMTQEEWEAAGSPEPKVAFTDGGDGTSMRKIIEDEGKNYLNPGGLIAMEVGSPDKFVIIRV